MGESVQDNFTLVCMAKSAVTICTESINIYMRINWSAVREGFYEIK